MEILLAVLLLLAVVAILVLAWKGGGSSGVDGTALEASEARLQRLFMDEFQRGRDGGEKSGRELRGEIRESLAGTQKTLTELVGQLGTSQRAGLDQLSKETQRLLTDTQKRLADINQAIAQQMQSLQEGNERKLEQMRLTVDEKLQKTLQTRLTESFEMVNKQLLEVQRGVGEMRALAVDVSDLKRVLANVKTRGTWGEVQLENLLVELLTSEQFDRNVETIPGTGARVEFAIRLPGSGHGDVLWLPVDSKFPQDDWARLQEAASQGDAEAVTQSMKGLKRAVMQSASDIREKYVQAPHTTDFGIMFLPTEGLYAEVLRLEGLGDELRKQRIVPAGPTTLTAILNSLRMGFRTLAIERHSAQIGKVLEGVKEEFDKFGGVIATLEKQLKTAQKTVGDMGVRRRAMARQLRGFDEGDQAELTD
ncbi:MAG: DNA recombination protein RmuC [Phycisphaerales bacterium]|nr:DNA recombination protein RmuC [Phycisphaerales bacterium]